MKICVTREEDNWKCLLNFEEVKFRRNRNILLLQKIELVNKLAQKYFISRKIHTSIYVFFMDL